MGDRAGIGAEIAVKTLAGVELYSVCRRAIVGDAGAVADAIRFTGSGVRLRRVPGVEEAEFSPGTVDVLDLNNVHMTTHAYGRVSADAGRAAFEYIRSAIELAMAGKADAVVTGPIHKESLNLVAGYHYSGQTEIFADLTGTRDYAISW